MALVRREGALIVLLQQEFFDIRIKKHPCSNFSPTWLQYRFPMRARWDPSSKSIILTLNEGKKLGQEML